MCIFFWLSPAGTFSPCLNRSLSLSLLPSHGLSRSFEEQALSISDILFSQGKVIVLYTIPNQTHVCLLSVTFLSPKVITMHHNPQVCSSHSLKKKGNFPWIFSCWLLQHFVLHSKKICSVKRTDNTQWDVCKSERVFLSVGMSTRN